jgi:hypothetical protein
MTKKTFLLENDKLLENCLLETLLLEVSYQHILPLQF